jgi:hypothetical protein
MRRRVVAILLRTCAPGIRWPLELDEFVSGCGRGYLIQGLVQDRFGYVSYTRDVNIVLQDLARLLLHHSIAARSCLAGYETHRSNRQERRQSIRATAPCGTPPCLRHSLCSPKVERHRDILSFVKHDMEGRCELRPLATCSPEVLVVHHTACGA